MCPDFDKHVRAVQRAGYCNVGGLKEFLLVLIVMLLVHSHQSLFASLGNWDVNVSSHNRLLSC